MKRILLLLTVHGFLAPSRTINGVIWSKSRTKFVPIFGVPQFASVRGDVLERSRATETHNFQGKHLTFMYYEEANIVNFHSNGTKVGGICGEIWNMLSSSLNFTLKPVRYHKKTLGLRDANGTYSDILGIASRNETDIIPKVETTSNRSRAVRFVMPLWANSHRLYIRQDVVHDGTWMVKLFSWRVWCATLMAYLLLTAFGFLSQRCINRTDSYERHGTIGEHFYYNFAMMCKQSYVPSTFRGRSRILELSIGLFFSIIHMAFGALLFTYVTRTVFTPPFKDLTTLLDDTSYKVVMLEGSVANIAVKKQFSPEFVRLAEEGRLIYVPTREDLYEKVCSGRQQYAMLVGEDVKRAKGTYFCKVNPTGIPYLHTWVAAALARNVQNWETISIGILKMHESGIIDALKDRWFVPKRMHEHEEQEPKPIGFDQVYLIFAILCTGVVVAFFIFAIEISVFYCRLKYAQRFC